MNVQMIPAALALFFFVVPPLLAGMGLVPSLPAFMAWVFSLVPGIIAVGMGLRLVSKGDPKFGLLGIALGLLPPLVIGYGMVKSRAYPPINDITTNFEAPPGFQKAQEAPDNQGRDLSYPLMYKSPQAQAYPDLKDIEVARPAPEVFQVVQAALATDAKLKIVAVDSENMRLEGEEKSTLFGFVDDFVVEVRATGDKSLVVLRSKSRFGQADFGANALRLRRMIDLVQSKLGPTS
ncbi:hypothetical protein E3A20_08530 [Planctomyces bekefii]|uniref:DUF1499 domain-containing protein n=1 Tax=Planctomyces bekefii TaxID=1653850 RepID=A0A5C6M7U3_9PLAN|nr:hypothetical protein E3A20_08530 [Planctomyces bekefii]